MAGTTRKFSGIAASLLSAAIAAVLLSACGGSGDQAAKTAPAPAKTDAAKPAGAAATAPVADQTAAAPTPLKSMSVAELLKGAGKALADARLVAPPGNNAAEYYLAVLDKDSNNNAARDGLREMFPMATGAIEKQINDGQFDEGKRAIDLLTRADPNNYALTILRGKLDLKKKQQADQDKQNQDKALAAAKAAAATQAAAPAPAPAAPAAAAPAPAGTAAKTATQTASATPPKPVAAAPAPEAGGESHPAKLLNRVNPAYPSEAVRNHQEGWVEVAFTVTAEGRVRDVSVVGSNPPRVFNASAVRAVEGWTFTPRMENGKSIEQQIRTRLEFKL